jgi:hypothetical protein
VRGFRFRAAPLVGGVKNGFSPPLHDHRGRESRLDKRAKQKAQGKETGQSRKEW